MVVENRNLGSPNHLEIDYGYVSALDDTLPWDGPLTLSEGEDPDAVFIINQDGRLIISEENTKP